MWLKIDTQGYEAEVLKGASGLMSHVAALECELSLVPLYDGQPLIDEMIAMIYQMGFRMVGVAPAFSTRNRTTPYKLTERTFLRNITLRLGHPTWASFHLVSSHEFSFSSISKLGCLPLTPQAKSSGAKPARKRHNNVDAVDVLVFLIPCLQFVRITSDWRFRRL